MPQDSKPAHFSQGSRRQRLIAELRAMADELERDEQAERTAREAAKRRFKLIKGGGVIGLLCRQS